MKRSAYFCPKCRRQILIPAFLRAANLQIGGEIKIQCGNCSKGEVVLTASDLENK